METQQKTETGLIAQKRAYLRAAVEHLKRDRKLKQYQIAEGVGDTAESFSGKLKPGGRGITDEYIDTFSEKYGIPFGLSTIGKSATEAHPKAQADTFAAERDKLLTIIDRLSKEVESRGKQIDALTDKLKEFGELAAAVRGLSEGRDQ